MLTQRDDSTSTFKCHRLGAGLECGRLPSVCVQRRSMCSGRSTVLHAHDWQELRLQLEKQASGSQPHPHWSHRLRPLPAPPLRRTRRRPRASSLSIGRGWRCRLDLFAWQAALWLSGYETSAAGPGLPWPGFQWPCQVAVAARGWATRIRLGPDPESTAGPGLPAAGGRWPLRGSGPGSQLAR